MRYDGKNVAVAINVHREHFHQVWECFARVHRNLPDAAVKVWINGVLRDDVKALCDRWGFDYMPSPNYFQTGKAPLWHARHMLWFADVGRVYNLKIDCDTMVDRTPRELPNADYFGSIDASPKYQFIQGGCEGLSLNMVRRIMETNFLHPTQSPYLNHSHFAVPEFLFCEDWALGHMCKSLNVLPYQWAECSSAWQTPVFNYSQRYAICHPRYFGEAKYGFLPQPPSREYHNE